MREPEGPRTATVRQRDGAPAGPGSRARSEKGDGRPGTGPAAERRERVIALIRGEVVARGADHLVVDVRGVGYKVFVPRHPTGDVVALHTHHVVREDAQQLYGFETREELALFEMLIGVSGVGPKAAMSILGVARPAAVAAAIASGDAAALARAPGVGKKTAERLIVDLKGKVARTGAESGMGGAPADDEAASALLALGYTAAEAAAALRAVPPAGSASTEERVTAALRSAGRISVAGR
jgi:Holliday junction DNA helicase RuvA